MSKEAIMIELHPQFITKSGKKQYAVIPYKEFLAAVEFLGDMQDLHNLEVAMEEEKDALTKSMAEIREKFGIPRKIAQKN